MATLKQNITEMASMVHEIKRDYRLNETTVMRIIDMNLAIAQQDLGSRQIAEMPTDVEMPMSEDAPTPSED